MFGAVIVRRARVTQYSVVGHPISPIARMIQMRPAGHVGVFLLAPQKRSATSCIRIADAIAPLAKMQRSVTHVETSAHTFSDGSQRALHFLNGHRFRYDCYGVQDSSNRFRIDRGEWK